MSLSVKQTNARSSGFVTAGEGIPDAPSTSAVSPQVSRRWAQIEGSPLPLGATWMEEEQAFNFAVYAEHADSVTLLLYCPRDLANKSGRIWHCRVPLDQMCDARYYGYSVSGQAVARLCGFDHEKVLLDPYAKRVFFPPRFERKRAMEPGPNDEKAPLGICPDKRLASIGLKISRLDLNRTRSSTNLTSRGSPGIPIPVCIPREPAPMPD